MPRVTTVRGVQGSAFCGAIEGLPKEALPTCTMEPWIATKMLMIMITCKQQQHKHTHTHTEKEKEKATVAFNSIPILNNRLAPFH